MQIESEPNALSTIKEIQTLKCWKRSSKMEGKKKKKNEDRIKEIWKRTCK